MPRIAQLGVIASMQRSHAMGYLHFAPRGRIGSTFAAFEEQERGSAEVGKLADLTVLSADIMEIPEHDILWTRCAMTVIGGDIVHDAREAHGRAYPQARAVSLRPEVGRISGGRRPHPASMPDSR